MTVVGRVIVGAGLVLVCVGAVVMALERFNINLGKLPGDIVMRGRGGTFYFPIITCALISVLLSLVIWLVNRR